MKTSSYFEGRARRLPRQARDLELVKTAGGPGWSRLAGDTRPYPPAPLSQRAGFTLIELIGVLAIMAIMASVIVPNVLHSIELASVKAEVQSVQNLGEAIKVYLRATRSLPTTAIPPAVVNWTTQLATYTDLSPTDILTNKRTMNRTYTVEPGVVPATRAILLSSMRTGIAVPTAASINTLARFDDVWNTRDGVIPSGASAALWGAWNASNVEYLIVQRVNLVSINNTDLRTFAVSLNNRHAATTVSYRVTQANGTILPLGTIIANGNLPAPLNLQPGDKVDLYSNSLGTILDYTAVFSTSGATARTFEFDAALAHWKSL